MTDIVERLRSHECNFAVYDEWYSFDKAVENVMERTGWSRERAEEELKAVLGPLLVTRICRLIRRR